MKLALCLFKYFPYGGLQRNFLNIAHECIKRGHEVVIYSREWQGDKPAAFNIQLLSESAWSNHGKNRRFYEKLLQILKTSAVDGVVGFNRMPGLDVYYAADTCFAYHVYEQKNPWYRLSARSRNFLAYEKAVYGEQSQTHIMLLSDAQKPLFQKYYQTPDSRFSILPPGISRDRIAPVDAEQMRNRFRAELGIGQQEKCLLFVGSDFRRKGLDRILQAMSALPDELKTVVRLNVIGEGKTAKYEQMARDLSVADGVRFYGARDDVPRFLMATDCLLHPAYTENTGNVILEAMVAGVPVLATAVCGYAFYIEQADMGMVVPEPFKQQQMNIMLEQLLRKGNGSQWSDKGWKFSQTEDIYDRPFYAVNIIEQVLQQKIKGRVETA